MAGRNTFAQASACSSNLESLFTELPFLLFSHLNAQEQSDREGYFLASALHGGFEPLELHFFLAVCVSASVCVCVRGLRLPPAFDRVFLVRKSGEPELDVPCRARSGEPELQRFISALSYLWPSKGRWLWAFSPCGLLRRYFVRRSAS